MVKILFAAFAVLAYDALADRCTSCGNDMLDTDKFCAYCLQPRAKRSSSYSSQRTVTDSPAEPSWLSDHSRYIGRTVSFTPVQIGFLGPEIAIPSGSEWTVLGLCTDPIVARPIDVCGVELSGIWAMTRRDVCGVQMGGLFGFCDGSMYGVQLGGLLSVCDGSAYGVQIAGFITETKNDMYGLQIGVGNIVSEYAEGVQIGCVNSANRMDGLQIGVINHSQHMTGLQIGAINIIKDISMSFMPIFNYNF